MNDLRQAAQQALECLKGVARGKYDGNSAEVCAALEAALAQQAEPVEPVAWVRLEAWKSGQSWPDDCFTALPAEGLTPLYTAPPQRPPLTDEEIDALPWSGSPRQFARAVERAHGIGEGA